MKLIQIPLIFSLVCLLFIACSKDKMLEKRVEKKDGEWKISSVNWTITHQSANGSGVGQIVRTGTTENAGTFTFDDGGSGKYSYAVDTFARSGTFTWTVDDNKINIISISQFVDIYSQEYVQKTVAYTGTEPSKNKLVLEGSETDQEVIGGFKQFAITGTFNLSR